MRLLSGCGAPAPAGGGAGPCHGAVARLYVAMVHAGRGCRVRLLPRGQTQPPGFLRRHAASLPVSAFFCRGALQQQGHGAADAVFVHAVAGAALPQAAGLSARRAVFSGGRHGCQHQGCGLFCVGADGAVRGGAGNGTAALGPPDGVHSGRNRRAFCGVLCPADPRAVERSGGVSALSAGQRVRLHALAGGGVVSRHAL